MSHSHRRIADKPGVRLGICGPGDIYGDEFCVSVAGMLSPPPRRLPAMPVTVSMQILGINGVESSSGSSCSRLILSCLLAASPRTWHAVHMKRTLPPLTSYLFIYLFFAVASHLFLPAFLGMTFFLIFFGWAGICVRCVGFLTLY